MTLLAGSGESKEQRLFPAQVWVISLMMWPEFVLIFGIPVTLLSNTEPTFKKDTLTLFHKACDPTFPEFWDPSARLHIYSCYVPVGGGFLEVKELEPGLAGGMVLDKCQGGLFWREE